MRMEEYGLEWTSEEKEAVKQPSEYLKETKQIIKRLEGLAILFAENRLLQTPMAGDLATQINNSFIPQTIEKLFSPTYLKLILTGYVSANILATSFAYKEKLETLNTKHEKFIPKEYKKRINEVSDYFYSICFKPDSKPKTDLSKYADEEILMGLSQFIEQHLAQPMQAADNEELRQCSVELQGIANELKKLSVITSKSTKYNLLSRQELREASKYYGDSLLNNANPYTNKALDKLISRQFSFINIHDPINSALNIATAVGMGALFKNVLNLQATTNPFTAMLAPVVDKIIPLTILFATVFFIKTVANLIFGRSLLKIYTSTVAGVSYTPPKKETQQFVDLCKTWKNIEETMTDIKQKIDQPEIISAVNKIEKEVNQLLLNNVLVLHYNSVVKHIQQKIESDPAFNKAVQEALNKLNKAFTDQTSTDKLQTAIDLCNAEVEKATGKEKQAMVAAAHIFIMQTANRELTSKDRELLHTVLQQNKQSITVSKQYVELCRKELAILQSKSVVRPQNDLVL